MGSEIHLRATLDSDDSSRPPPPRIKPPPQSSAISAPFSYSPSDDGIDENLLILLHGLGSHPPPFFHVADDEFNYLSHLSHAHAAAFFFLMHITTYTVTRDITVLRYYPRRYPCPIQQIKPFFQASPDGHARLACTRAVRHVTP